MLSRLEQCPLTCVDSVVHNMTTRRFCGTNECSVHRRHAKGHHASSICVSETRLKVLALKKLYLLAFVASEFRSCVKVEVAVLGSRP